MPRCVLGPCYTAIVCGGLLFTASCGSRNTDSADVRSGTFSVMSFNLGGYALLDRDGDGQKNDPKPEAEQRAALDLVKNIRPDILALQEVGHSALFDAFRSSLREAGMDYPYAEYLHTPHSEMNLAVLSRAPIAARYSHADDAYSMSGRRVPVTHGFVDLLITVQSKFGIRLLVADLPSKTFHPLGQTEMRRNEARLLGNHVRSVLKEQGDARLIVLGTLNDRIESAALREIVGQEGAGLVDLKPEDRRGDIWTWFDPEKEEYRRIDYILVSPAVAPLVVRDQTRVVRDPSAYAAKGHSPLTAVFRIEEEAGQD